MKMKKSLEGKKLRKRIKKAKKKLGLRTTHEKILFFLKKQNSKPSPKVRHTSDYREKDDINKLDKMFGLH